MLERAARAAALRTRHRFSVRSFARSLNFAAAFRFVQSNVSLLLSLPNFARLGCHNHIDFQCVVVRFACAFYMCHLRARSLK